MAEMNELHFETIDRNKDINMQRNKIKFLEDRIATLEKTLESHAKILARFQMTEANEQDFERHEKLWGDKS